MSIQKCAAIVMGVLVLCTACGKNAPDLERHPYTEEEKIQLSSNGGYDVYNPGLEANCILSDLVIEGIILDGAVTDEAHSFIGSGTSKKSFAYTYTDIPVWVDNVLYGGVSEDVITLRLAGDETSLVTKPRVGDQLILFLAYNEDMDVYNACCLEGSMFIKNPPDDTVFTFSNMPVFSKFDGEPFDSFKQEIAKTYETLRMYVAEHPVEYLFRGRIVENWLAK